MRTGREFTPFQPTKVIYLYGSSTYSYQMRTTSIYSCQRYGPSIYSYQMRTDRAFTPFNWGLVEHLHLSNEDGSSIYSFQPAKVIYSDGSSIYSYQMMTGRAFTLSKDTGRAFTPFKWGWAERFLLLEEQISVYSLFPAPQGQRGSAAEAVCSLKYKRSTREYKLLKHMTQTSWHIWQTTSWQDATKSQHVETHIWNTWIQDTIKSLPITHYDNLVRCAPQ